LCDDSCVDATTNRPLSSNGACQDSGEGSLNALYDAPVQCLLGTDCSDCGGRFIPSASPSPPVSGEYPGCQETDFQGDLDANGYATLGDAVYVALSRLDFGVSGENPISCLEGDFDSDGSFTLNDAAYVAEAQFGMAYFPWAEDHGSSSRQLGMDRRPSTRRLSISITKKSHQSTAQLQVEVQASHAAASASAAEMEGRWKALSMQFTGGRIAAVKMHHGSPGQITAQHATLRHSGSFFQAAELGGGGLDWPTGLAATVTFEPGTDMDAVEIDHASMNTYVVQYDDPTCVHGRRSQCTTAVHYGQSEPGHG